MRHKNKIQPTNQPTIDFVFLLQIVNSTYFIWFLKKFLSSKFNVYPTRGEDESEKAYLILLHA